MAWNQRDGVLEIFGQRESFQNLWDISTQRDAVSICISSQGGKNVIVGQAFPNHQRVLRGVVPLMDASGPERGMSGEYIFL